MSEPFGWCPNDHKTPAKPEPERTWLSSGMTPYTADGEVAGYIYDKTPAQQFAAAAVDIAQNTVERFQARCATEEAMKDTEIPLTHTPDRPRLTAIADTCEMREATKLIELLKKDNFALNNRIEALEAENDEMRTNASEALETLERVAYVLRTFYFAELSLSTIQPLIALAIEFNPSIVEQRR